MPVTRLILTIVFLLSTVSLVLFFLQRQATNYNFSFEPERERVENLGKVLREFEENLPEFEVPPVEVTEELKKKLKEWSTSSTLELIPEEAVE